MGPRIFLVLCLVLACVKFLYMWSSVNDLVPGLPDHSLRLLAQGALLAASDSVREATLSLFAAHEGGRRTAFEWHALNHSGTKLDSLQTSLDDFHRLSRKDSFGARSVDIPDIHRAEICESLAGKRITMIGGEHIYRLHLLLLQHRERAEKKPFPCPYHEFCTHHRICLSPQYLRDDALQPRYVRPPTAQELIETESAAVNYIVSDTLLFVPSESFWAYNLPFVDPSTGIRLRETYWLAAARKANVVILGRGPLSAPGSTYTGNWSFLRDVPDYVVRSRAASASEPEDHDDKFMSQRVPRSFDILNMAVHLTVSRFLPDLFQLLRSIRREVRPSRAKRLIWPSNWYRLPGRGTSRTVLLHSHVEPKFRGMREASFYDGRVHSSAEYLLTLHLSALINADVTDTAHLEDPWTFLFNIQGEHTVARITFRYFPLTEVLVYLQNMVLRKVLPQYGIVFLPLDVPWVQDVQPGSHEHDRLHDAVDVDDKYKAAIEQAFLAGMDHILSFFE